MIFDQYTRLLCNHDAELIPLLAKYMGPVFEKNREETLEAVQH